MCTVDSRVCSVVACAVAIVNGDNGVVRVIFALRVECCIRMVALWNLKSMTGLLYSHHFFMHCAFFKEVNFLLFLNFLNFHAFSESLVHKNCCNSLK